MISPLLKTWKESGILAFGYSLLVELLALLYLLFLGLFTLEILLPGFVSVRINMAVFLATLIILTAGTAMLGRFLGAHFPATAPYEKLIVGTVIAWGIGIIGIALISFPWWSLAVLLAFSMAILFFLRSILLEEDSGEN